MYPDNVLMAKPCPCCGSSNIDVTTASIGGGFSGIAECLGCGLKIERDSRDSHDVAWRETLLAWNKRYAEDLKDGLKLPEPDGYIAPKSIFNLKSSQPSLNKEWCWNLPSNDLVGFYSVQTIKALFPGTKECG